MATTSGTGSGETPDLPWSTKAQLLWAYARPHRGVLGRGTMLGLVGTVAGLATPMVTKSVLDGLSLSSSIRGPVTVLAVLLVASSVIGLVQAILLGELAEKIILSVRSGMVRRLLRVRVEELANRPSGELVARVTSDTLLIRDATTSSVVNFINGTVGLVGALVLMGVLDVVLLLTTLAVLLLVTGLTMGLMPRLAKAQERAQAEVGTMAGRLEGALRALRTVKASRAEHREADRIISSAKASAAQSVRAVRFEAVAWTITGAGMNLAVMLVLAVGAWRVSNGALSVSALVAFLLYAFQLMLPVMLLTMGVTSLQSGLAAAARIAQIDAMAVEEDGLTTLARPSTEPGDAVARSFAGTATATAIAATATAAAPGRADAVLALDQVSYCYAPDAPAALDGVSITVPRRSHTAIVGPSGAGKTTIFSLLLKFLQPQQGRLSLDGRPFEQWTLHDLRSRIAYVEQDTPLVPGTLRDNLVYAAPGAGEAAVWDALATVRLSDRVRELPEGLDTELSPTTMSGGERQRVAIARALVAQPEILLLDEATAQLDGLTEAAVAEGIRRLAATGAVITIAHRLSTVIDAEQIVVLEAGRVRAVGTHAELIDGDALYRDLVAALRIAGPVRAGAATAGV